MSKAAAIAATGIGGGGAALGGYLIFNNSGSGGQGEKTDSTPTNEEAATPTPVSNVLSSKTLTDFTKAETKGESCGKHVFGDNLDLSTANKTKIDSSNKIEDGYFDANADSKSCLVINWEKTTPTDTNAKWKGGFRWAWSFSNGTKGFIIFTTTKLSSTEKQLDLEGGIYFVTKGDGDKWTVDKYSQLENKHIGTSNWSEMFPKAADASADAKVKGFGDFISSESELNNVCKSGEDSSCTGNEKTFKGSWTWTKGGSGTEKLNQWCTNLDTCFSKMYDTQTTNLTKLLGSFTGAWKQEQITPTPAS